ncbi:unnamed protein product [Sphagnum troendelagicum]|uniref:Uncharacterized protein n=1 Tax=Sphagnum troendelagicum TaxID=128251 RepID=A0ABP0TM87_9BRYO
MLIFRNLRVRFSIGEGSTPDNKNQLDGRKAMLVQKLCLPLNIDNQVATDDLRPGGVKETWDSVNVASVLSLRIQQLDVQCETKSKDNVFVIVMASVQYRAHIETVEDAFYKLTNPREQIKSYVFDAKYSSPCCKQLM